MPHSVRLPAGLANITFSVAPIAGLGALSFLGFRGLIGLVILVLDIMAIIKILQGSGAVLNKALWIVVILVLPLLGLLLWYFLGRK